MGYLTIPHSQKDKQQTGNRYYKSTNYTNPNAVKYVINDITRQDRHHDREYQLVCYGGYGVATDMDPAIMIQQFEYVQHVNHIDHRKGNRMFHEVYRFTREEAMGLYYDPVRFYQFAYECAYWYYERGHQVVFAVHCQINPNLKEGYSPYHIHFAVNSINFEDGLKLHCFMGMQQERNILFNEILKKYMLPIPEELCCPIKFVS